MELDTPEGIYVDEMLLSASATNFAEKSDEAG
jgi:hypothetical protein